MKLLLTLILLSSSVLALPCAANSPDAGCAVAIPVRDVAVIDSASIEARTKGLESAAIIKRDFNDIPTPVQPNAVYRLLGAVSFTVTQIAPGILEMAVRNQLTRGVTAGLSYTEGSDQEATSTSVGPRSVQMLRIYPPRNFGGSFEITANRMS